MTYAAWSVVFGEQPSAAKWNVLGSNDASFNDGTGIANLALNTTAISNPYKFSAYRAAALTPGSAVVVFDTEEYDTNSNYSTSTGIYTAPVAGYYMFAAGLNFTNLSSSTGVGCSICVNGVNEAWYAFVNMYTGNVSAAPTVSKLLKLSANDEVTVKDSYGCGFPLYTTSNKCSFFTGHMVSIT